MGKTFRKFRDDNYHREPKRQSQPSRGNGRTPFIDYDEDLRDDDQDVVADPINKDSDRYKS